MYDVQEHDSAVNRRLRLARPWLILLSLAAIGTFVVGQYWLFADSDFPVLQTLLLAVSTTVAWIVMSLSAIMGRNISPLSHMQRVAGVFACGLLVPVIFGTAFFQFPELRAQICPTCEKYIESARDLRIAAENDPNPLGKLEGAEYHARMAKKT